MVWGFLPASPFPILPSVLLLLPISLFSFSTFDLIPLPTIDPRVSLPLLPVLYKITLVTTVSARQGGLIHPLGVLTSLGRTNRFNSLPSRYSPWTACTTNQPSSAQWFHNCRFSFSFSLPPFFFSSSLLTFRAISSFSHFNLTYIKCNIIEKYICKKYFKINLLIKSL